MNAWPKRVTTVVVMRISKRRVWFMAAILMFVALVVGFWLGSNEPTYGGRPLSYWFNELPPTLVRGSSAGVAQQVSMGGRKYGAQHEKPQTSLAAITGIGMKGLPFLLRKLGRREAPVTRWIEGWAVRFGVKRTLFPNPELQRAQAVTAVLALSPLPPSAVEQIRRLDTQGTNSSVNYILAAGTNEDFRRVLEAYR